MRSIHTDDSTDESLVLRVQQHRDQAAFDELFRRYYKGISRFFTLHLRDESVIEDLTQETFRKATQKLSELLEGASFKSWLYRISWNILVDYWRQKKRDGGRVGPFYPEMVESLEAPSVQVEEEVIARILFVQTLEEMPPLYRDCLDLHEQGLEPRAIAERLGLTKDTVKVYISKGKRLLREALFGPCLE